MSELSAKECVPCKGGVLPLQGEALSALHRQLGPAWQVVEAHHLERDYKFPNFITALEFTNKVGALAEKINHHPDIHLAWGKTKVIIWTHKTGGLTENDFVFAAKVDDLYSN